MRLPARFVAVVTAVVVVAVLVPGAVAHEEREAFFPEGDLGVPTYRASGPALVVCKPDSVSRSRAMHPALRARVAALAADCGFNHIQDAINAVTEQGSRILVLPGIYREEPSLEAARNLPPECEEFATGAGEDTGDNGRGTPVLSYEEQRACPHAQNLIAVFGDSDDDGVCDNTLCNLQIEGVGARPTDVIIDGDYTMLNGIRGDRADGLYLRNLTVQRFEFNAVYVLETDGFAFDQVVTRWNDEYGFLSFAVDHGLYENCEGYGNGDSAVYPGSASDINAENGLIEDIEDEIRFATEIRGCRGHHNTLGYSGTAGNSVWAHHNEFDSNATGAAMDSLFPDHPGLPQDHALFEHNLIHSNNTNYYTRHVHAGDCTGPFGDRDYDHGVVCPVVPVPVGTGTLIAGGNHNLFRENAYYDNRRQGIWQFWIPAFLRGEEDPTLQFDTSNFNTYRANRVAENPAGWVQPNGIDFVWDGEGEGNCWADNTSAADAVTYGIDEQGRVPQLPGCDSRPPFTPGPTVAVNADCANYHRDDNPDPSGCRWFSDPAVPAARQPDGAVLERVAGSNRVGTAVAASQEGFPGHADVVVLARADLYPDALAGAPLAAALGGPMLLTFPGGLDEATAGEITRLGATRAVLLGGEEALSAQVETDLAAIGVSDVVRVSGGDRFDTAAQIARLVGGAHAFLAKGLDADPAQGWADALAASSVAALLQRPILLTTTETLPASTAAFLDAGDVTDVQVVGGTAAVSDAVLSDVEGRVRDVGRIAGPNRLETSLALARYAHRAGADPTELWLATAGDWPDGIAAGPAVAVDEGVLLLVGDDLGDDSPVRAWLDEHAVTLENLRLLGGAAAVNDDIAQALRDDYGAADGDARGDRSQGNVVTGGTFALFDGAPAEYAALSGTARMIRTLTGTTRVQVFVQGLPSGIEVPAHVHAQACEVDQGGAHFKFDPEGGDMPPNEIHPRFVSDAAGVGMADVTEFQLAGASAVSVVLHTPDGEKVACANLG